jgi:alkylation response protein AidB-like acyl-CoA dehydrogenase
MYACRHAARALDAGAASATMDAAMAKRFATDACFGIASDAMQVTCNALSYVRMRPGQTHT